MEKKIRISEINIIQSRQFFKDGIPQLVDKKGDPLDESVDIKFTFMLGDQKFFRKFTIFGKKKDEIISNLIDPRYAKKLAEMKPSAVVERVRKLLTMTEGNELTVPVVNERPRVSPKRLVLYYPLQEEEELTQRVLTPEQQKFLEKQMSPEAKELMQEKKTKKK